MNLKFITIALVAIGYHIQAQVPVKIQSVYGTELMKKEFGDTPIQFLSEEINRRMENEVPVTRNIMQDEGQIVLLSAGDGWPNELDKVMDEKYPLPFGDEGYRILSNGNHIYIQSRDQRGLQFGIGQILRESGYNEFMTWDGQSTSQSPEKSIRGHQIGYRNTANSYDAWTPEVYEQYIRDLIVFGANSLENIPFADPVPIHFTIPADSMNIELGCICNKYDMDYWVWTPIEFDLNDRQKAEEYLRTCEKLYRNSPRLDGVFVPGGDPGHNPPELVLPAMEKMAEILHKFHPQAKLWLSLQGFESEQSQFVYQYMNEVEPEWMGGLVAGPSSPPLEETRKALSDRYQLRHYPDITHTVRCQYPNWWWDPAFNFTLGREPINPQPVRYQNIYEYTSPYTDGFITYSDGMHDDLNKMVWSRLGWESTTDIHDIVREYANYFLSSPAADEIVDGLFALERNWDGAVKYNGSIEATKTLWEEVNDKYELDKIWEHWRWKMYLLRARYDAFIQERFVFEEGLEEEASEVMCQAGDWGSQGTMDSVRTIFGRSLKKFKSNPLRNQIFHLADDLFEVIGYQPSVPLYQARNPERGAIIDFIDRPLNNQWWILSEFDRIEDWSEDKRIARLEEMGQWEDPGAGGYYDDIGNIYKSSHVVKVQAIDTDPLFTWSDNPGFDWWDDGYNKSRLSWMSSMRWPYALKYQNLDTQAAYFLKLTGVGEAFPIANGQELEPTTYGTKTGEIKMFPIPQKVTRSGYLEIRFKDIDESHLNWRKQSRLNEAWLIRE